MQGDRLLIATSRETVMKVGIDHKRLKRIDFKEKSNKKVEIICWV